MEERFLLRFAAEEVVEAGSALDDVDRRLIAERMVQYNHCSSARVGDYVEYTDGVIRRVGAICRWCEIEATGAGNFYLGRDGVRMSGGGLVDRGVPHSSLTLFGAAVRLGRVWIYHHADRSLQPVEAEVPFWTFRSTLPAPACE